MSVVEHLEELRVRIVKALAVVATGTGICFWFRTPLLTLILAPVAGAHLIFTAPAEYFMTVLKMSVGGGLVLALPVILYQLAAFAAPGLTREERRWIFPLATAALLLFVAGVAFSYLTILPVGLRFLLGFAPSSVRPMITIGNYLGFALGVMGVTGLAFELPLILLFLAMLRLVTSRQLASLRKYFVVVAFAFSAVFTPTPDLFTQSLLAGALVVLYELSIWLIRLTGR